MNNNYFNVGWGGVRSSTLPYALEPSPDTGHLTYADPAAVDYLPLCPWNNDDPDKNAATAGRAVRTSLADPSMSGYTTFVQESLVVREALAVPPLPCKDSQGTMQASCTQADIEAGAVRLELFVREGRTPNCRKHNTQASRLERANGLFSLECEMHDKGFDRKDAKLHQADPCRPWSKLGLLNTRTDEVLQVEYIRHWSWQSDTRKMYFSVASTSTTAAINMVNTMFNNEAFPNERLHITLVVTENPAAADYDPNDLGSFTLVYGKGVEYQNDVEGHARRRIGSTKQGPGTRDFAVFTINW